jgi:hypothetical protein
MVPVPPVVPVVRGPLDAKHVIPLIASTMPGCITLAVLDFGASTCIFGCLL